MSKQLLEIIYEDENLIAINKPAGLLTIPDRAHSEPSLKAILKEKYGEIFVVHRLDKDTSGLVLFAKNAVTHQYLSVLFEKRKVEKYYAGIVQGTPAEPSGLIDAPIAEHPRQKGMMHIQRNGKESQTSYTVLEAYSSYSLVSFQLHTGRTHQIRVHARHLGNPLACDPLYGDGKPVLLSTIKKKYKPGKHDLEEQPMIQTLALHAHRLVLEKQDGTILDINAPIPKTFRALLQQLKKLLS